MQSVPLLPAAKATGAASTNDPVKLPAEVRVAASPAPAQPATRDVAPRRSTDAAAASGHAPAPLRRGLGNWNPQLHQDLSNAQQAQDFLDRTAAQLQGIKAELSAKLAGLQSQDSQLQAQLQQLAATWHGRHSASGGSLDPQLRFSTPAVATQRFSVRGLDLQTLTSGSGETLAFSVGGTGQGLMSVSIPPGLSPDEVVRRFDHALAPAGIRVASDDSGALIFSVSEGAWPAVRDTLSVKGDGIRFPTGQLTRVKTDAEPAAVQPEAWQKAINGPAAAPSADPPTDDRSADAAALRRALQQIVQSLDRVRQARVVVARALAEAAGKIDQARPREGPADAKALAANFQSVAGQQDYASFSSVSSALVGISRSRVISLLALPPTS
jgi:hypothetical protein